MRLSDASIPKIYQNAQRRMENISSAPAITGFDKGTLFFDEVSGNKMRTYIVKPDGQRQFYKEQYYSGPAALSPQYRVREAVEDNDLSKTIVHTKTDVAKFGKEELKKMDYNTSGFVDKGEAMKVLRTQISRNVAQPSENVSGNFRTAETPSSSSIVSRNKYWRESPATLSCGNIKDNNCSRKSDKQ
jgi:hypothetical protein